MCSGAESGRSERREIRSDGVRETIKSREKSKTLLTLKLTLKLTPVASFSPPAPSITIMLKGSVLAANPRKVPRRFSKSAD